MPPTSGATWDDGSAGTLRQLLAYKVVGRWHGGTFAARVGDAELAALGPEVVNAGGPPVTGRPSSFDADLGVGGVLAIRLGSPVENLDVELNSDDPLTVVALSADGAELYRAAFADGPGTAGLSAAGIARIEFRGTGVVSVTAFRWRVAFVERYGLIPGISPADPGPPVGPGWLTATLSSAAESRRVEAELDWETRLPGGPASRHHCASSRESPIVRRTELKGGRVSSPFGTALGHRQ